MELVSYQKIAQEHSPVVADYIERHLEAQEAQAFKLQGIPKEQAEKLIEEWVKV